MPRRVGLGKLNPCIICCPGNVVAFVTLNREFTRYLTEITINVFTKPCSIKLIGPYTYSAIDGAREQLAYLEASYRPTFQIDLMRTVIAH